MKLSRFLHMCAVLILTLCLLPACAAAETETIDISMAGVQWTLDNEGEFVLTLVHRNEPLEEVSDYTIESETDSAVIISGAGGFTGSITLEKPDAHADLEVSDVSGWEVSAFDYTGTQITPVSSDGYTVQPFGNVLPGMGTARMIANGEKGEYGAVTLPFDINLTKYISLRNNSGPFSFYAGTKLVFDTGEMTVYTLYYNGVPIRQGSYSTGNLGNRIELDTFGYPEGNYTLGCTTYTHTASQAVRLVKDSEGNTSYQYVTDYTQGTLIGTKKYSFTLKGYDVEVTGLSAMEPAPAGHDTIYLNAVPQPESAQIFPADIKWSSSNYVVASVKSLGVVTLKKPGTTTITATYGDYSVQWELTVPIVDNISNARVLAYYPVAVGGDVLLYYNGAFLEKGVDYTVSRILPYEDVVEVTITGCGLFNGSATVYFHQSTGYPLSGDESLDDMIPIENEFVIENGVLTAYRGISTYVIVPDSVTTIAATAFAGNNTALEILLPDSVTTIEAGAFSTCALLERIAMGGNVTFIGENALGEALILCPITGSTAHTVSAMDIVFADVNAEYLRYIYVYDDDPAGQLKLMSAEIIENYGTNIYRLPEELAIIGPNAVKYTGRVRFYFKENVVSIDPTAFEAASVCENFCPLDCASAYALSDIGKVFYDSADPDYIYTYQKDETGEYRLWLSSFYNWKWTATPRTLPEGIYGISAGAFAYADDVTELTISEGVVEIGDGAFYNADTITAIYLPSTLRVLGANAFNDCSNLKKIVFQEGLTSIPEGAFIHCDILEELSLPESVTTVGDKAFKYCSFLKTLHMPGVNSDLTAEMFHDCNLTTLTLGDGIASIANEAFSTYEGAISWPTRIYCGRDSVTGKTLSALGKAFIDPQYLDFKLIWKTDDAGNEALQPYSYIGDGGDVTLPAVFTRLPSGVIGYNNRIDSLTFPESYVGMDKNALYYLQNDEDVYLSDGMTDISASCFYSTLPVLHVNRDTDAHEALIAVGLPFVFKDDIDFQYLYAEDGNGGYTATLYAYRGSDAEVTVPEGVTVIGESAFKDNTAVTKVILPVGVTAINGSAFYGCSALADIILPDALTAIGEKAFYNCSVLTQINIPGGVTSIGNSAFGNCTLLERIDLPENIASISGGFAGSADVYVGMHTVTAKAFGLAGGNFYDPEHPDFQLSYSADSDLGDLVRLTNYRGVGGSVVIPEGVQYLKSYSLTNAHIVSVKLPSTLLKAEASVFSWNENLTALTIPEGVISLPDKFTNYCQNIETLTLPASLANVSSSTFYMSSPTTVICPAGSAAYTWASRLYNVTVITDAAQAPVFAAPESIELIIGTPFDWMQSVYLSSIPEGLSDATILVKIADESLVAESEGQLSALGRGTTSITFALKEMPGISVTVPVVCEYEITSVTLPVLLAKAGSKNNPAAIMGIQPEGAHTEFTWRICGSSYTGESVLYDVPAAATHYDYNVTPTCGDTQRGQMIIYTSVNSLTLTRADSDRILPGGIIDTMLTADVRQDGMFASRTCTDPMVACTYTTSDPGVIAVENGNTLRAISSGTAAVTVTLASGESASLTIEVDDVDVLVLPVFLTEIGDEAFMGINAEVVVIPEGCTSIGSRAFADCPRLTEVRIPDSVTYIADDAFSGSPISDSAS